MEKVKEILREQKQEQLLQSPIQHTEEWANTILEINFDQINKLYEQARKKEKKIEQEIEPIVYVEKEKLPQRGEEYKKIGENLIKRKEYAVVTMAGGQRNEAWT